MIPECVVADIALVAGSPLFERKGEGRDGLRDLQTLAKWPIFFLHVWQTRWKAGHCLRPPG